MSSNELIQDVAEYERELEIIDDTPEYLSRDFEDFVSDYDNYLVRLYDKIELIKKEKQRKLKEEIEFSNKEVKLLNKIFLNPLYSAEDLNILLYLMDGVKR